MKRSNNVVEPEETISHADGAMELEPPKEGETLESAPDGGLRAWLIVLACAGINALWSIMQILILYSFTDFVMASDTGVDSVTQLEMYQQLVALTYVYAPLGAFVMIFLGYRATVCIGAGVVMISVIFLSYLCENTEHMIKFLLYGPTAIGISFIQLGALIPVLEYFTTKRIKALFLSRLGSYLGQILLLIILIPAAGKIKVKWREYLRGCTGLCVGIGLLGLTLKELKLIMKDDESMTFVQRTLGLGKKEILKNVLLWCTCAVFFFYQWGIETPQGKFSEMSEQLGFDGNLAKLLFYSLSQTIGMVLGMFLAWMFKKVSEAENSWLHAQTLKVGQMNIIFGILAAAAATMGIACLIALSAPNFGYFFTFSLLFAAVFAFCEGLRDDIVPDEFGRDDVRIAESLILMSAGLGGVITNEIVGEIDAGGDDDWKDVYGYGGGMLLWSTLVTSLVLFLNITKTLEKIPGKISSFISKN